MAADILYEEDFVLWAEEQAERLRRAAREGSNLPLDWEHLAEEIESLGRSDRREARSLVQNILIHLLKLSASPAEQPRLRWEEEVDAYRQRLTRLIKDSPSLKKHLGAMIDEEWAGAARLAAKSLRAYGENDAAARVDAGLSFGADQVFQEGWYPPRPRFTDVVSHKAPRL